MSHFVINHPNSRPFPVHQEAVVGGMMNEISRRVIYKVVNINSCVREEQAPPLWPDCCPTKIRCTPNLPCNICDRCCYLTKWKSSNFIVRLPEVLDKVVAMKLSAIEIPNTIYTISATMKTNVFQLVNDQGGEGENNIIIELPAGNYEIGELVDVINNTLDVSGCDCSGCHLQAGYDKISGKFYFYAPNSCSDISCCGLDFRLPNNDRDIKLNLGWILGFRKALYCCDSSGGTVPIDFIDASNVWLQPPHNMDQAWPCRTYVSDCCDNMIDISANLWDSSATPSGTWPNGYIAEGIIDLTGPKYLFLVVNDYNNNVTNKYISLVSSSVSMPVSNILARISMPVVNTEIRFDDTSDLIPKTREYFGPVSIEKLHIQLVDEMGRIVDLNNNDISLLLEFQCLYNL